MQILHEMSDAINESGYAKLINGIASARRARRKTGQSPRQLNRDRLTAASEKHTAGGANKTESNEPLRHQGHRSASFGAHDQSEELNAGLDHTMARLEMQKEEIRVLLKGMKPS